MTECTPCPLSSLGLIPHGLTAPEAAATKPPDRFLYRLCPHLSPLPAWESVFWAPNHTSSLGPGHPSSPKLPLGQPPACLLLLAGAQKCPLDPGHLIEATGKQGFLDTTLNAQQARHWSAWRHGTSHPVSRWCSLASESGALPTVTCPSLSLAILLATSGLLCYSAHCMGEV